MRALTDNMLAREAAHLAVHSRLMFAIDMPIENAVWKAVSRRIARFKLDLSLANFSQQELSPLVKLLAEEISKGPPLPFCAGVVKHPDHLYETNGFVQAETDGCSLYFKIFSDSKDTVLLVLGAFAAPMADRTAFALSGSTEIISPNDPYYDLIRASELLKSSIEMLRLK